MSDAYRRAGVDLEAAAAAVERIRELAAGATRPEIVEGVGGFAGLFRLEDGRMLAAATDGVGTKTEIARAMGRLDTLGIDLVAMCANDVLCTGAEPLLFLDYLAVGKVEPETVGALVAGIAEGCRRAGCALLGGETAEHPGVMEPDRFDLAGFCVGLVSEDELIGPRRVREGDALVGLASSGLHANGFSLVRRVVDDLGLDLAETPEELDRSLGEELLEPTAIYVGAVLPLIREGLVRSAAHITGGGMAENLPRALPVGLGAEISPVWTVPKVFRFLASRADISMDDMRATFNMGIGMVLVVGGDALPGALRGLEEAGVEAMEIGRVRKGSGVWQS
ncbi:MAG TPA: phosphoribosylformylglycinamidine cyclo-ligase [Actinomycetota bacterium]